jgi:hypothetical protein
MHLPAFAQALGFGHPGQGFIFFYLLQNRCCITRSYLLQTVISKGDTQMTTQYAKQPLRFEWSVTISATDGVRNLRGKTLTLEAAEKAMRRETAWYSKNAKQYPGLAISNPQITKI